MSGAICEIIIHGNVLQAQAQAACELAGTSYDGQEVMSDAQKDFLADLMKKQVAQFRDFLKQFLPAGDS